MKTTIHQAFLLATVISLGITALAQNTVVTTKILDNGPDTRKKVFAIVSEGYSGDEIAKYSEDVNRLVMSGVLGHDLFGEYRNAFNAYRVDLLSNESGVSGKNGDRDSALRLFYSGDWNRCWMEDTAVSDVRLRRALNSVPRYDYVLVILNEEGFGGCRRGTRLYVTRSVAWDVVAHEYGHGIANLFDEYWTQPGLHPSSMEVNDRNCSTALDRNRVVWKELVDNGIGFPPSSDSDNPQLFPTVGMFKGCNYKSDGIYRASRDCRMKSNTPEFCPVCRLHLKRALDPFAANGVPGPGQPNGLRYLSLLIEINDSGQTQVLSASEIETGVELRNETMGNYAVEILRNNNTSDVLLLSEDPFEVRSFADPNTNNGEMILKSGRTTVRVNIPNINLESVEADKIGIKLHQLRSDQRIAPNLPVSDRIALIKQFKPSIADTIQIKPQKLASDIKFLPKGNM